MLTQLKSCQVRRVACYLDADGEVPTERLIKRLQDNGIEVYLPAIRRNTKHLAFRRYTPTTALRPNRYGVLEPAPQQSPMVTAKRLDAVILPLVGFDRRCNRLGMGGGFYDATFAFLLRQSWHPLCMIGLAYEQQRVDYIPTDPWDISLDRIISESATYHKLA